MNQIRLKALQINTRVAEPVVVRETVLTPFLCSVLAGLGIVGGISSLFIGIVFVIIYSVFAGGQIFNRIGTGLLIVAIPMILIGAVFLDEIKIKK